MLHDIIFYFLNKNKKYLSKVNSKINRKKMCDVFSCHIMTVMKFFPTTGLGKKRQQTTKEILLHTL